MVETSVSVPNRGGPIPANIMHDDCGHLITCSQIGKGQVEIQLTLLTNTLSLNREGTDTYLALPRTGKGNNRAKLMTDDT